MLRKLQFMVLLIACTLTASAPARSSSGASGQILGGSPNSPIKLEVFSDFQCPACRELFLNTIRPILRDYSSKNKVCVVYHEYPLNMHPYSRIASRYTVAASKLGRHQLLPVFEKLFIDQTLWARDGNIDASLSKALPREDFLKLKRMAQDPSIQTEINKGLQLGKVKGVDSTPTMFISSRGKKEEKVEGFISYPVMKQFIDSNVK